MGVRRREHSVNYFMNGAVPACDSDDPGATGDLARDPAGVAGPARLVDRDGEPQGFEQGSELGLLPDRGPASGPGVDDEGEFVLHTAERSEKLPSRTGVSRSAPFDPRTAAAGPPPAHHIS